MTTCAPSDANRRAVASPIPLAPPVTTATRSTNRRTTACSLTIHPSVAMNTFFSSVNASSASGPSSRPRPDCLKPPNGVE